MRPSCRPPECMCATTAEVEQLIWDLFDNNAVTSPAGSNATDCEHTIAAASCVPLGHGNRPHVRICTTAEGNARRGPGTLVPKKSAERCLEHSQACLDAVQRQHAHCACPLLLLRADEDSPHLFLTPCRTHYPDAGGGFRACWRQIAS